MSSPFAPTVNSRPLLAGKSNVDDGVDVAAWFHPTTHRLLVDPGSAGGGSSAVDDSAFTVGTDSGTPIMGIYESSPGGPSSRKLQRVCENYTPAHY